MNPETYIHNELANIWYNDDVKEGDKITTYQFDNDEQVTLIDFICQISNDYQLNVNEVLLKYIPDIESKKTVYIFIMTDKHHGDKWVVLRTECGKEIHINIYETNNCFYSVNS